MTTIIWIATTGTVSARGFLVDPCNPSAIEPGVTLEEWDATMAEADAFQATGQPPQREPDRVIVGDDEDAA